MERDMAAPFTQAPFSPEAKISRGGGFRCPRLCRRAPVNIRAGEHDALPDTDVHSRDFRWQGIMDSYSPKLRCYLIEEQKLDEDKAMICWVVIF